MVYPIVMYGDAVLRKKAKEIVKGEIDMEVFAKDMFETMAAAHGIGLAAPQIGKSIRVFVVDGTVLDDQPELHDLIISFSFLHRSERLLLLCYQSFSPNNSSFQLN